MRLKKKNLLSLKTQLVKLVCFVEEKDQVLEFELTVSSTKSIMSLHQKPVQSYPRPFREWCQEQGEVKHCRKTLLEVYKMVKGLAIRSKRSGAKSRKRIVRFNDISLQIYGEIAWDFIQAS
jgi:hypothetical protein